MACALTYWAFGLGGDPESALQKFLGCPPNNDQLSFEERFEVWEAARAKLIEGIIDILVGRAIFVSEDQFSREIDDSGNLVMSLGVSGRRVDTTSA
jgi:hypothetical protein